MSESIEMPHGETCAVGVDFGSSRIKAAAYADDGRLIAIAERATPVRRTQDGDDFLVLDMLEAAAHALHELRLERFDVRAVGLGSMGEVGTLLGPQGLADLAFPSWYDSRGAEVVTDLTARFGADEILVRTAGHTRVTSTVAKLGWLARQGELPHGTFVGLCGALAWQLTGEAWQEQGLAITSGVFNWASDSWIPEYWTAAGLGSIGLPTLRPAGWSAPATTGLAGRLGIPPTARVVIAGHDHPVAAVGTGMRADEIGDSMGTGEALIAVMSPSLAADVDHCRAVLHGDPDLTFEVWPATGERLAVWERMRPGLALQSFLDHSGLDRTRLDQDAPPPSTDVGLPLDLVRRMERGEDGGLPRDATSWGVLIDHYCATARVGEGIVRAATGADGGVVLTGGGLRSPRWRHAKVAHASSPQSVSLIKETATRGAAAIAGAAAGLWPDAPSMPGAHRATIPAAGIDEIDRAAEALAAMGAFGA